MGKPGVYINCDTFNFDADSAAFDHAMPAFRHMQVKSSDFYKLRGNVKTIRPLVEMIFDEIIDALITPLTPEETTKPTRENDEDYLWYRLLPNLSVGCFPEQHVPRMR